MNKRTIEEHKFANINASCYTSLVLQKPLIGLRNDKHIQLSLKALVTKGIWGYLKNIKPELLRSRIMFGFIRKRSKGTVKYFISRWWFLISSRPLNMEDFLMDPHVLGESQLPPLFEFDTLYQYYMDTDNDDSAALG